MFWGRLCHPGFSLRLLLCAVALFQGGSFAQAASTFEQDQRINSLSLQTGTDSFATVNKFGAAFTSLGQNGANMDISNAIAGGAVSVLIEMPGLTNLTGSNQPSLEIGLVNGQPVSPADNPTAYSGVSDLDWWYTPSPDELDAYGVPTNQLPSAIAAGVLNVSGGRLNLVPSPFGSGGFVLSSIAITATVGSSSEPLESTNGFPPGHLPGENINPSLVSFASMSAGRLKGNISAASLAATPLLSGIAGNDGYTTANSFLDLLVSGYVLEGILKVTVPEQPDQSDPAAGVAGAGPPYIFTANAAKVVTTAHDKNGTAVPLATALQSAAYSAYFTFTTDRVIVQSPPAPLLTVTNSGSQIVVSWPSSLTGWTLQTNNNLATGTWGNYAGAVVNNSVTNPLPAGNLFFRLNHP